VTTILAVAVGQAVAVVAGVVAGMASEMAMVAACKASGATTARAVGKAIIGRLLSPMIAGQQNFQTRRAGERPRAEVITLEALEVA
jgi:hypothetical protein